MVVWISLVGSFMFAGIKLKGWLCEKDEKVVIDDLQSKYPDIPRDMLELAKSDENVRQILENYDRYDKVLLDALSSNAEMSGFVANSLNKDHPAIDLTNDLKKNKEPLLLQWDERWGYETYGDSYLALTGCGPTALSMVLIALLGDASYNPWTVAQYAQEQGFYQMGVGTSWLLMSEGAQALGLTVGNISLNKNSMQDVLEDGGYIICSMLPGDFTKTGHFIVLSALTSDGEFVVKDPNSRIRSERTWSYAQLQSQISNLWAYY